MQIPMKKLRLGDRVRLFDGAYGDATVITIVKDPNKESITFIRPYVHTSDFSYTQGVIPYLGFEHCVYLMDDEKPFTILEPAKEPR